MGAATLGYVDPRNPALARLFNLATPEGGAAPEYVITAIDSPELEHDNQYAVYKDGRVERAYRYFDEEAPEGDPLNYFSQNAGGLVSSSGAAALGLNVDGLGDRDGLAKQGRYSIMPARRPQGTGGTWDRALGAVVAIAFQTIASIFVSPYAVAAAQAVTGERIGDANKPVTVDAGLNAGVNTNARGNMDNLPSAGDPGVDELVKTVRDRVQAVAQLQTYINPRTRQRLDVQHGAPVPEGFVPATRDGRAIEQKKPSSPVPLVGLLLAFLAFAH